jgi:hypothetical protein
MQTRRSISMALAAFAIAVLPAAAHHGWGGQGQEEFQLSGTVEQTVSLAGPHATMKVRAQGQVWDITLAPAARTSAAGLNEKTIPVGSQVTIHGHRSTDPKRFEVKTERVTWNGKTFAVYPNRD